MVCHTLGGDRASEPGRVRSRAKKDAQREFGGRALYFESSVTEDRKTAQGVTYRLFNACYEHFLPLFFKKVLVFVL